MESGMETTARIASATCSPSAKEGSPPAASARRTATGAPGEIDMRTMPTSAARGSSNARATTITTTGTSTRFANSPRAMSPECPQAERYSRGGSSVPSRNMITNSVAAAKGERSHAGIGPPSSSATAPQEAVSREAGDPPSPCTSPTRASARSGASG